MNTIFLAHVWKSRVAESQLKWRTATRIVREVVAGTNFDESEAIMGTKHAVTITESAKELGEMSRASPGDAVETNMKMTEKGGDFRHTGEENGEVLHQ